MAQTTPAGRVKADHGSKKDLVEKLKALATDDLWLKRLNDGKSFQGISNSKLVRLHGVLTDVKQRFGSRDKLVDALVAAQGRGKDGDYKKHFAEWPLPRLMDALKTAEKRAKAASAKKGGTPAKAEAKPAAKPAAKAAKPAAKAEAKPAAKKGTAKAASATPAAAAAKPAAKKGTAKKGAAKA